MPYEPLHHKYRPQTFNDLVGQETIALTLSNALKQERIAPAYLFTGPRGTGKTSSARILAKSLNCLNSNRPTPDPCGKCKSCLAIAKGSALDVMEIDAASNTGVDNIREIIERSRFAPVQCRYKIYAIDECHMLSTAAFNALLKTLEEPPPQVVFILATTDPQRVLSTIISRCQRFDYRRIPLMEMTNHLRYIANESKIAIADDALTLIAQIANGGLRDAESLLDQLSLLPEKISVARVWDLVGAVPEQDLLKLLQAINGNDSLVVLEQCRSLLDRGREPLVVLQNLASFYLNLLIAKTAPERSDLTAVTETCWQRLRTEAKNWDTSLILRGQQHLKEAETQLKNTTQPRLWLEVTLLGLLPEVQIAIANPTVREPKSKTVPQNNIPNNIPVDAVSSEKKVSQKSLVAKQPENNSAKVSQHSVQPDSAIDNQTANHNAVPTRLASTSVSQSVATPVVLNPNQNPTANQEIWSKVVSCLQPPTTQALLKQQCHLVSFDGVSAIVGISSAKLQKLNQGKVPNIEAAFAQVCQRKVKVQLEVANAKDSVVKNSTVSSQPVTETRQPLLEKPPTPYPTDPTANTPAVQAESSEPIKPNNSSPQSLGEHNFSSSSRQSAISTTQPISKLDNSQTETVATQKSVLPSMAISSDQIVSESSPITNQELIKSDSSQEYVDDDLQQAIDNLTQSFEGEVVQLNNNQEESIEVSKISSESDISSPHVDRPKAEEYDDDW